MSGLHWRLYYADGSTWDAAAGWDPAPAFGVQFVIWPDPDVGRGIDCEKDYVILPPWSDRPMFVDWEGVVDFLRAIGLPMWGHSRNAIATTDLVAAGVKFGRMLPYRDYQRIRDLALADPDFPPKSGRHVVEMRHR